MSPQVLQVLLGRVPDIKTARLKNHSRHPVANQVFPGMIVSSSSSGDAVVEGRILMDVTALELDVLDWFEGNEYQRIQVDMEQKEKIQTYLWSNPLDELLLDRPWDYNEFCKTHLEWYLSSTVRPCRRELDKLGVGFSKSNRE